MKTDQLRVLYVEDDDLDRMILQRAVKSTGLNIELTFAEDIETGREATLDTNYDCIFLDYNLPGGSGIELLKSIRAGGNKSPVIIVTSQGDEKLAVEAMKSGANDYIPKKLISPEGVAQTMRHCIRMKEAEEERQRIEKDLRSTQIMLETVVVNAPIILFSLDSEKKFTLFKGKGVDNFNIDKANFIGTSLNAVKTLPIFESDFEKTMQGEEHIQQVELEGKFYEIFYAPLRELDGTVTGVIGVSSNITSFKNAERELENAKRMAEDTAKVKEQFLANMSHEIRTPMNGIIGLTRILLNTQMDEEQMRYLKSIKISSDNLLVIINDILDFSKIEAGKMTFEKVPFRLREIARHTEELFSAKAEEKGLQIVIDMPAEVPAAFTGDPTRLSQIFNNLVSNAIKFTSSGSVTMHASVKQKSENKCVLQFEVTDTGIGIPASSIGNIFESFTQASSDTARKYGGTGLGLTIVKKLIELQGGEIGIRSTEGKGTTFFFHLEYEIADENSLKEESQDEVDNIDLSHLNVLLAEDNLINQMVVKKIFKDWQTSLDCAENGEIVLRMMQEKPYDIVLMDLMMPVVDGYTAVRKMRDELPENFKTLPVIAMTAHATQAEIKRCHELGMNEYVSKPFDPMDLKRKIAELTKHVSKDRVKSAPQTEKKSEDIKAKPVTAVDPKTAPIEKFEEMNVKPSTPINTDYKIDLSYLRQIADNNSGFMIEMMEMFLQKTPEALNEMQQHYTEKNWGELRNVAHRIKPSFGYIGIKEIHATLAQIEACSETQSNLETIPDMMKQVQQAFDFALEALTTEIAQLK